MEREFPRVCVREGEVEARCSFACGLYILGCVRLIWVGIVCCLEALGWFGFYIMLGGSVVVVVAS